MILFLNYSLYFRIFRLAYFSLCFKSWIFWLHIPFKLHLDIFTASIVFRYKVIFWNSLVDIWNFWNFIALTTRSIWLIVLHHTLKYMPRNICTLNFSQTIWKVRTLCGHALEKLSYGHSVGIFQQFIMWIVIHIKSVS